MFMSCYINMLCYNMLCLCYITCYGYIMLYNICFITYYVMLYNMLCLCFLYNMICYVNVI